MMKMLHPAYLSYQISFTDEGKTYKEERFDYN